MEEISNEQVITAFTDAVREQLMAGKAVTVPGLGTFDVRHEPSQIVSRPDGSREMRPPRDVISFRFQPVVQPAP